MGVMTVSQEDATVTFKSVIRQWWSDPRSKWDPANFSDVSSLLIDSHDVWVPDTVIREDAGSDYLSDFKQTPIVLYSSGLYYWTRLGELTVSASLDFSNYPYDR